jgi:hypothetical protein
LLIEQYIEWLKLLNEEERNKEIKLFYSLIGVDDKPVSSQMLSWCQIREMAQSDITYGSHTHKHVILKYCDNEIINSELKMSKEIIERETNKEIDSFSYPNARFNLDNWKMVARYYKYGFKIGNAKLRKGDNQYYLPRILVYEQICEEFAYLKMRLIGVPKF